MNNFPFVKSKSGKTVYVTQNDANVMIKSGCKHCESRMVEDHWEGGTYMRCSKKCTSPVFTISWVRPEKRRKDLRSHYTHKVSGF